MQPLQESPFAQVRFMRAHEHIVEQLQQLILSGQLAAGSRLPSEREMMAEFRVSRPTVREALRVAESMGLISVRPGGPAGSKVLGAPSLGISRVFDSLLKAGCTSALELIELRMVIDSSAAALACMQPKRRLAPILAVLQQMQDTTELREFAALDAQFHQAVIVAGGNRLFVVIYQALLEPIHALIENSLKSLRKQTREETLRHHAAIFEAIKKGDAHLAARAVRTHLREFYSPLLTERERLNIESFLKAVGQTL